MVAHVWDAYANWHTVTTQQTDDLKRTITGPQKWAPNHLSPSLRMFFDMAVDINLQHGSSVTAVDFGCGLGRNAPLMRRFFPRVIGLDLPNMITRLRSDELVDAASLYDSLYDDLDTLISREKPYVIYESVVFQHIVDRAYAAQLVATLLGVRSFRFLVSLINHTLGEPVIHGIFRENGWLPVFEEVEEISFCGAPHRLSITRRPL